MPILAMDGFLDVNPTTVQGAATGGSVPIPGCPYNVAYGSSANFSSVRLSKVDGWLQCENVVGTGGTNVTKFAALQRPLADALTFRDGVLAYGGFRFRKRTAYYNANLISFNLATTPVVGGTWILSYPDLPGAAANKEFFFEWAVDTVTRTVRRRIDGVRLSDVPFNTTINAAFLSGSIILSIGTLNASISQAGSLGLDIRDVYFGERTAEETSDWLGPIAVEPLPVSSITSPWAGVTQAGGAIDPLVALNTPITGGADMLYPVVRTDSGETEATLKVDAPTTPGKVLAVSGQLLATRAPGVVANLSLTIGLGASVSTPQAWGVDSTQTRCPVPLMARAPDGSAWTKQRITDMVIKLKPGL